MGTLLKALGWLLIASAAGVMLYSALNLVASAAIANALPAALLVALGGHLLTQGKNANDALEKRSLFYLESCVKAYEEARDLLSDGNNDRVRWIAAGRALVHAKELANNVTDGAHCRVLELHKLKYRGFFHGALADKTAAFFFGVDPTLPTDQAAALSTAREERSGRTITSTLKELSDKSLRAVWEASQWPPDFEDPLGRRFSPEEHGKLAVLFPGLHEFLEHKEGWHSASGRLHPRTNDPRR